MLRRLLARRACFAHFLLLLDFVGFLVHAHWPDKKKSNYNGGWNGTCECVKLVTCNNLSIVGNSPVDWSPCLWGQSAAVAVLLAADAARDAIEDCMSTFERCRQGCFAPRRIHYHNRCHFHYHRHYHHLRCRRIPENCCCPQNWLAAKSNLWKNYTTDNKSKNLDALTIPTFSVMMRLAASTFSGFPRM